MYTETFKELPIADIKDMSREDKIEYMRQWFNENYENPVNSCPYESSEGGYIYIWGGPYDAKEELDSKFSEIIEDDIIQELVDDLENESLDWSGIMNPDYDQNDYLDIFMEDKDPKNIIFEKISDLRKILDDYEKVENTQTMYHMIYAYSITALEAFLSEYFSLKILNDEDLLKKFIKTNEDFMRVSFQMNEVIEKYENIKQLVNEYLTKILWHNLAKVSNLYEIGFGFKFPKDIGGLYKSIITRHDIVHRSGKTKNGDVITINKEDISRLFENILKLVEYICNDGKELPY